MQSPPPQHSLGPRARCCCGVHGAQGGRRCRAWPWPQSRQGGPHPQPPCACHARQELQGCSHCTGALPPQALHRWPGRTSTSGPALLARAHVHLRPCTAGHTARTWGRLVHVITRARVCLCPPICAPCMAPSSADYGHQGTGVSSATLLPGPCDWISCPAPWLPTPCQAVNTLPTPCQAVNTLLPGLEAVVLYPALHGATGASVNDESWFARVSC